MPAVVALALILVAPLLLSIAVGAVLPQEISLGGMIVAFFLGSIVSVFLASEAHAGKIRSASDLWSMIVFGCKAFGWWAAAAGCIFALVGLMHLLL